MPWVYMLITWSSKARHAALVFGDQLGLEAAQAVTEDVEPHLAAWGHYSLLSAAIAMVARLGLVGQMVIQFSGQHALCAQLLELARQASRTRTRFGILVLDLGQQLVDQFDRDQTRWGHARLAAIKPSRRSSTEHQRHSAALDLRDWPQRPVWQGIAH
jgi:hypothetical protein